MSARRDFCVTLGERKIKLRMTIGALARIEKELNTTINQITDDGLCAETAITILRYTAEASKSQITPEFIDGLDPMEVYSAVSGLLRHTLSAQENDIGDSDPVDVAEKNE
jgi:hypothetical protein